MSERVTTPVARPGPIPAVAGIGLRAQHHRDILEQRPAVGWLEAHSENYFALGGSQPRILEEIRAEYPLSLHGVGLSLGSVDALDRRHLENLKRIVERFEPALVSEHLSWGSVSGRYFNDLLPLPYTVEALNHMVERVTQLQEFLGCQILIENVSSYLEFTCSSMSEPEFLATLAAQSGCGLLLDLNNIYVSAQNHGFDAREYIARMPLTAVREIHLAGHGRNRHGDRYILIDTHGTHVCSDVWALYAIAIQRFGDVPTLIEWDTDIPALPVLVEEAHKADSIRETLHALAA
ncbi:MAG TPA: DUF692 domain-containing protein [Steroidobacteraceae bacterium]|nr:DUF692 domain-containing protein [Steroidobacteraceae bacterium]